MGRIDHRTVKSRHEPAMESTVGQDHTNTSQLNLHLCKRVLRRNKSQKHFPSPPPTVSPESRSLLSLSTSIPLQQTAKMNAAARQIISRRFVTAMGPRLTSPARYASTAVGHSAHPSMTPKDRQFMRGIFTVATVGTAGAVAYGAARSGGRMNSRFVKRNSTLDSTKWFSESSEYNQTLGSKH
ncbi:hypothetical protein CLAIMM_09240 [Cladophialophora immunda]|nr:hypothetical protein CLAIMM_09240 [Cladophialophora immunda]